MATLCCIIKVWDYYTCFSVCWTLYAGVICRTFNTQHRTCGKSESLLCLSAHEWACHCFIEDAGTGQAAPELKIEQAVTTQKAAWASCSHGFSGADPTGVTQGGSKTYHTRSGFVSQWNNPRLGNVIFLEVVTSTSPTQLCPRDRDTLSFFF